VLDQIGTIVLMTAIIVNFGAVAVAMGGSLVWRISFLMIAGLWTGFAVVLAAGSALLGNTGLVGPVPPIGVVVLTPLVAVAVALVLSPALRRMLLALPTDLLIGLNTIRIIGVFFLLLVAQGRLGGPFPQSAGWGDIATGVAAPLVVLLLIIRAHRGAPVIARVWNGFGALDLVAAVALGAMSADGAPLQVFHTGIAGPLPVQSLPWSLIPTVLVPFWLVLHGIIHVQLRRGTTSFPRLHLAGA
jgi:hypothetical protein